MAGWGAFGETSKPSTPGAKVGGTLTIGVSQDFKDMDPRIANSVYDSYVIASVFDRLVELDPYTLEPRPFVAKSWEVLSEDRVRFYLNEGIKFHNGDELTAEDVAFTFNWMANPANNSPNFTELVWLEQAVVVNKYTVDIVTKADYAPWAPGFATESQAIVPMKYVLEVGDAAFNQFPIGSGPYKFVEWRQGDRIILERNENYWLVYPNLDRVVYRVIPELSVMMLELEAGGIDIADNMPAQDVERFRANPKVEVLQVPSLSYFYVFFNMSRPPSSDIRYRKAVYMSVDMDAAVFSIFQNLTGVRAYGCIPPRLWASDVKYLKNNIALQYDPEEAARLIAELKAEGVIPPGYKTTIYCPLDPRRTQLATIIATGLREVGLDADVQPLAWGPYLDLVYRSEADPLAESLDQGILGWSGGPDPHDFIYYMFHSDNAVVGSADNLSFYMNPLVDWLLLKAATTLDQHLREWLYTEAQRIIYGDYVHIPGYHYIETRGVRTSVQGYNIDPLGNQYLCTPFVNVWIDPTR
ncbi:ABC transporter substrate-binding protein [Candidatus Bipolaricaulota bacterium]|nr:ABC transporter substrate-binding protein [Candidatus Bipolaricaulota bacterium]